MCRAEADWLVGINATRALTCKYNAQLSCGRVQTPTLAMIASREEEIRRFVPKPYYGIRGRAGSLTLAWKDKKSGSGSSFQKERIENILKEALREAGCGGAGEENAEEDHGAPALRPDGAPAGGQSPVRLLSQGDLKHVSHPESFMKP